MCTLCIVCVCACKYAYVFVHTFMDIVCMLVHARLTVSMSEREAWVKLMMHPYGIL